MRAFALLSLFTMCATCLAADDDPAVQMSLRGNVPEGKWETYTRRPSGLVFQQLILRASGAEKTYPGLERVNSAVEVVLRKHNLLPAGDYTPAQVPTLESGAWAKLPEADLADAKEALVAYFRDPAVNATRSEATGSSGDVTRAEAMRKEHYPKRTDEWEKISYWTIHTFSPATTMARGLLGSKDPQQRLRFAQEFRDWVVAYAGYKYYTIPIPGGNGLGGVPHVWGDQWHMERTCSSIPAYFTFLTPDAQSVTSASVPEFGGERFDFWCLKFLLDQLTKADGFAGGYRGGNHGWFQIRAAVTAALLLPEFKASDRALQNALKRAVEHCLDDNRLDGWHREATLGYLSVYVAMEADVLNLLAAYQLAVDAWIKRTGVDLTPYLDTLRQTMDRQKRAPQTILLPDGDFPRFGDCADEKAQMPVSPPDPVTSSLPGVGVYVMRSGWEAMPTGRECVGLALNAMDALGPHNDSDLLSVVLHAYGTPLLDKPKIYRYEIPDHWYKRSSQAANTAVPGDFADDSQAPAEFGAAQMYPENNYSPDVWPVDTWKTRFDQSGAGPTLGWRGGLANCARVLAWAGGPEADLVDAFHDRYVRAPESPWPTGDKPFGPRMRRTVLFVRSSAGNVEPYALLTDRFTNPGPLPLAGNYRDLNVLFHIPVADGWREKGLPWKIDATTKALRTTFPGAVNLSIVPADPEKLVIRQPKGLWSATVPDPKNPPGAAGGPGVPPGASFGGWYSYLAPYVAYALPGSPAPVPACVQMALFPDRPGLTTELRVTRLPVSPAADPCDAGAVQVDFPALGVRDLFLTATAGVKRTFGGVDCDGAAAWVRLKGDQVLAATLFDGTVLRRGGFSLTSERLTGKVVSAQPDLYQGFVVNRLKLQGASIPPTAVGRVVAFRDAAGQVVASYQILRVIAPDEVLLSEARRTVSTIYIGSADPATGTLSLSVARDGLFPGQPLQVFQEGRSYVFRIAEVKGTTVRVTAPDGAAPDLSAFTGKLAPGFGHAYDVVPAGCSFEVSTVASHTVAGQ